MNKNEKTLILGMGNEILTDDGIGPRLAHDLSEMFNYPHLTFETACCGGLEIMEYMKGYNKVVILDAIRTSDGDPGNVYYFLPSGFRETSHLSNLHDINFLTSLNLANALELDMPSDLHIIAVEIVEDMEFSEELTLPLREKYPVILKEVHDLILKIIE